MVRCTVMVTSILCGYIPISVYIDPLNHENVTFQKQKNHFETQNGNDKQGQIRRSQNAIFAKFFK